MKGRRRENRSGGAAFATVVGIGVTVVSGYLINNLDELPGRENAQLLILAGLVVLGVLAYVSQRASARSSPQNETAVVVDDRAHRERVLKRTARLLKERQESSIAQQADLRLRGNSMIPVTFDAELGPGEKVPILDERRLGRLLLNEMGGRKVLVLGEPGAGKTTLMMRVVSELAATMLDRLLDRNAQHLGVMIPVWVDLGRWHPDASLEEFVQDVMAEDFGTPEIVFRQWFANRQLLLVFDNLGWLPSLDRAASIKSMNAFLEAHRDLDIIVLAHEETVRTANQDTDLKIDEVLRIRPLSDAEIVAFLDQLGPSFVQLRKLIKTSPELREAMRSRMFASVAALVFSQPDQAGLTAERFAHENARDVLIDGYLELMLHRQDVDAAEANAFDLREEPSRKLFLKHLGWIASSLDKWQKYYFYDWVDGFWLPDRSPAKVRIAIGLGVAVGAVTGLILGSAAGIAYGAAAAYIVGALSAVLLASAYIFGLLAGGAGMDTPVLKPRLVRGRFSLTTLKAEITPLAGLVLVAEIGFLSYVAYNFVQPAFAAWSILSTRQHTTVFALLASFPLLIAVQLWVFGHDTAVVETDRSWEAHSPSTAKRRLLARQLRLSFLVVLAAITPVLMIEVVRFWVNWLPTGQAGTGNLLADALQNLVVLAAGVWLAWMLGTFGYLLQVRLAVAALRRGGYIPENFPGFVHQAARLSLLQPYGGNEFAFAHSIVRERLASLASTQPQPVEAPPTRHRRATVTALLTVFALATVGGVYASGGVPYGLMPDGLRNGAWIAKNCDGPALGLPAKCPDPSRGVVEPQPVGNEGTLISFGDSFSAGEGAPRTGQYQKVPLSTFEQRLSDCQAFELSCDRRDSKPRDLVWDGDSGYYAGTDEPEGNACHRSPESYPPALARELQLTLDFRACSGAMTGDYLSAQDEFPSDTKLVTVGFGGSDVHLAQVVKLCAATGGSTQQRLRDLEADGELRADLLELKELTGSDWDSCAPYTRKLIKLAAGQLGTARDRGGKARPGVLDVLRDLRRRTPAGGRVILTSYPHLFPDNNAQACGVGSGGASLGPTEQAALNDLVDTINEVLRVTAVNAAVDFVDMTYAFVGQGVKAGSAADHGLCQDQGPDDQAGNAERWVNRFRLRHDWTDVQAAEGSMHPNVPGQAAYAGEVLACYRDRAACDGPLDAGRWRDPALLAIGCTLPPDEPDFKTNVWDKAPVKPRRLDVTGDRQPEMVVEAQCPSTTSSLPTQYAVFDTSGTAPRVLGVLGEAHYYREAKLTATGKTVVVSGTSVGGKDPSCCANHVARDVYQWDGSTFRTLTSTEIDPRETREKAPPGPVVDAVITAVDLDRQLVTYDVVQWFTGKDAEKACADDTVSSETEWCHDYYWRNANGLLRTNSLLPTAKLELVDETGASTWRTTTVQELATVAPASKAVYTLRITNNQITAIKQRFTP
ncbi:hypothetical protein GCM10027269_69440 [Kribbella endophytica]